MTDSDSLREKVAKAICFTHPCSERRAAGQCRFTEREMELWGVEADAAISTSTVIDVAVVAIEQKEPYDPDDVWWEGYQGALIDSREALLSLKGKPE